MSQFLPEGARKKAQGSGHRVYSVEGFLLSRNPKKSGRPSFCGEFLRFQADFQASKQAQCRGTQSFHHGFTMLHWLPWHAPGIGKRAKPVE